MANGVIQKEPRHYPLVGDQISHTISTSGANYTATSNGYMLCQVTPRSGDSRVASVSVNGVNVIAVGGILNTNYQLPVQGTVPIHKGDEIYTRNLSGNEAYYINIYYTD